MIDGEREIATSNITLSRSKNIERVKKLGVVI